VHQKTWELQERTRRFAAAVTRLALQVPDSVRGPRIMRAIVTASKAIESGYRDTCASSSPERFIAGVSTVARNAKKAKTSLVLPVQLDLIAIEAVRELILEARGLEAIFLASKRTAEKRAGGRRVSRRNPSERAAQATDGKTPRKRQDPPGVT
jgi:hypothetical protein